MAFKWKSWVKIWRRNLIISESALYDGRDNVRFLIILKIEVGIPIVVWYYSKEHWIFMKIFKCKVSVYGSKIKLFSNEHVWPSWTKTRFRASDLQWNSIGITWFGCHVFFQYDVYFIMNVRHCLDLRCQSRWTGCRSCHVRSPTLNHLNFLSGACYVSFLHKVHLFYTRCPVHFSNECPIQAPEIKR